jgi:hypothetical protein
MSIESTCDNSARTQGISRREFLKLIEAEKDTLQNLMYLVLSNKVQLSEGQNYCDTV